MTDVEVVPGENVTIEDIQGTVPYVGAWYRSGSDQLQIGVGNSAGTSHLFAAAHVLDIAAEAAYKDDTTPDYSDGVDRWPGSVRFGATELNADDVLMWVTYEDGMPLLTLGHCAEPNPCQLWEAASVIRMMAGRAIENAFRAQEALQAAQRQQERDVRARIFKA